MSQSLSQIYVHAIFGTKNREKIITPEIESELHSYISGVLKHIECPVLEINSVPDHIHILYRLSKNISLAKSLQELKRESSAFMKLKGISNFTWQGGYGAFSVSSSKIETVRNYIKNQKEHHKTVTFKNEVEQFFKEYGIDKYDTGFFWNE